MTNTLAYYDTELVTFVNSFAAKARRLPWEAADNKRHDISIKLFLLLISLMSLGGSRKSQFGANDIKSFESVHTFLE